MQCAHNHKTNNPPYVCAVTIWNLNDMVNKKFRFWYTLCMSNWAYGRQQSSITQFVHSQSALLTMIWFFCFPFHVNSIWLCTRASERSTNEYWLLLLCVQFLWGFSCTGSITITSIKCVYESVDFFFSEKFDGNMRSSTEYMTNCPITYIHSIHFFFLSRWNTLTTAHVEVFCIPNNLKLHSIQCERKDEARDEKPKEQRTRERSAHRQYARFHLISICVERCVVVLY